MKTISLLLFCVLCLQCSADRSIERLSDTEVATLEHFQRMEPIHTVSITGEQEPGEKLLLCVTFVDKNSKNPLVNKRVLFYHTNTNGDYEPSNANDETTARLHGSATTNSAGNIYVSTILPGDYGSSENNRHIHTGVFGARPEAYDIFFEQYSRGFGSMMNSGNDQIFYATLRKTKDNRLVGFVTIEVKNTAVTD